MATSEININEENAEPDYVHQLEERIDSLESRNLFQEDVIEQLSGEIAAHQQALAELKQQLQLVASRLKEAGSLAGDKEEIEPPPPHY